jgi:hypothetical protein
MHLSLMILAVIIFANNSSSNKISKFVSRSRHPGYGTVENPNIPLEYDCALRAFGIEMAAYIAPTTVKTNWTTLSQSAFQMNQCNSTSHNPHQPSSDTKPFKTAPEMKKGVCHHTIFVNDLKGNDLFDGTFERPMKSIEAALSVTRTLRVCYVHPIDA